MLVQPKTWVEISRSAIRQNIRAFKKHLGKKVRLMTVVKSNAYGHGLVEFALEAQKSGTDWFGVDSLDEALQLRQAKIRLPVVVLGYTAPERFIQAAKADISLTVYSMTAVHTLRNWKNRGSRLRVHLEIETGITRQGLEGKELLVLADALRKLTCVEIEGAFTHFANIEDTTDTAYADQQLRRFHQAMKLLEGIGIEPPVRHTACSAAAILFPQTYFTVARVGISSYGFWPSKETQAVAVRSQTRLPLRRVLSWKTRIAQVKQVPVGTPISYGLTEKVQRSSKVAVIPIGYWDGFDRGLSRVGHVLVRGRRCKVLGRVCMNMCMVDVTDVPGVKEADEVVLIGRQRGEEILAEDLAAAISTIQYEIVARINPFIPRRLVR